jgi:hypothetical protein
VLGVARATASRVTGAVVAGISAAGVSLIRRGSFAAGGREGSAAGAAEVTALALVAGFALVAGALTGRGVFGGVEGPAVAVGAGGTLDERTPNAPRPVLDAARSNFSIESSLMGGSDGAGAALVVGGGELGPVARAATSCLRSNPAASSGSLGACGILGFLSWSALTASSGHSESISSVAGAPLWASGAASIAALLGVVAFGAAASSASSSAHSSSMSAVGAAMEETVGLPDFPDASAINL